MNISENQGKCIKVDKLLEILYKYDIILTTYRFETLEVVDLEMCHIDQLKQEIEEESFLNI